MAATENWRRRLAHPVADVTRTDEQDETVTIRLGGYLTPIATAPTARRSSASRASG